MLERSGYIYMINYTASLNATSIEQSGGWPWGRPTLRLMQPRDGLGAARRSFLWAVLHSPWAGLGAGLGAADHFGLTSKYRFGRRSLIYIII